MVTEHDPAPVVTFHDGLAVLRDDLLPGGTKRRFLTPILRSIPEPAVAYAGPSEGYAQLALGHTAKETGHEVHYFVAARTTDHPLVTQGRSLGVQYHQIKPGYLTVLEKRARDWVAESPTERVLLPLGFHSPQFHAYAVEAIRDAAKALPPTITAVWVAWGSGLLATAIRDAIPHVHVHAVVVGRAPKTDPGPRITLYQHPDPFSRKARVPPPYPSAANYDAKVWVYARTLGGPAHLIWNVGA